MTKQEKILYLLNELIDDPNEEEVTINLRTLDVEQQEAFDILRGLYKKYGVMILSPYLMSPRSGIALPDSMKINIIKPLLRRVRDKIIGENKENIVQTQERGHVQGLTLPSSTRWEEVTLKFLNGHDVIISCRNFECDSDYKQMGLEDKRKRIPNEQWKFLEALASLHGELAWGDQLANSVLKKRKQLLSKALKKYFQINEDPFFPYRKFKLYKIKMNLEPER